MLENQMADRPNHVPDAAVFDFDMFLDAGLLLDPHERVREILRDAPPVFWTPRNGGHWMIVGYAENYEASRNTETFSSELIPAEMIAMIRPLLPADVTHIPLPTPINLDPPSHTKFRAPLQAAFSPRAMMARKEEIRELANELIDQVIDRGSCDFIPDIAEPLPVQVFLKMLGLPLERLAEFRALVHEFLAPPTSPIDPILRMRKVADAMKDDIEARRTQPRDDLLSLLWASEIEGRPMTAELMEDFGVLLFIAGLDTVINGMGFGVRHLALHTDFQKALRANPKLIVDAAEELLRRYTFTVPTRRVAKDTEFAGWQMKVGERVQLFLPGGDLDPREFADPHTFDLGRENNVHIAFGVGPHRCLGSHLARIELQVIYEQMLARLPEFRLDPNQPAKFHAGNIIAIDSLPIRWD
ncbi:cytochrome P450 [Novosphingobium sp. G106]|uniref:cytochrome P450 n=1 Tax=Novosphingobium sp. G106 TaxID=2849500 RepID=UPI001C2D10D9|nr:cytochrome P450 [Novosphingobium sp. G106]MBV1686240.1 cytochrome P450 [Novosphingobium sp. G106]